MCRSKPSARMRQSLLQRPGRLSGLVRQQAQQVFGAVWVAHSRSLQIARTAARAIVARTAGIWSQRLLVSVPPLPLAARQQLVVAQQAQAWVRGQRHVLH